jgi:superfamily II DNA or RNA helicase
MQTYKLVSDGSMLLVDPWIPGLSKECVYYRTAYSPFGDTKKREREELFHLQQLDDRLVGYIADGLTDKIRNWLDKKQIPYTFESKHYWKYLPVPEWEKVDFQKIGQREGQEEILTVIATNYNGVIDAPTGFGKSDIIVQICLMYSRLNIVLVTNRKSVVKTLYERLVAEKSLRGRVGAICSWKDTGPDFPIVVTTTKSLEKTNYDKCDLLLFDECHGLAAPGTAYKLAGFRRARKFGFSASPIGRGDKADMVLEGMLGPIRHTLSYQQGIDAGAIVPIDVHIYTVGGSPIWNKMHIALKRQGLWQNETRNQCIAKVAREFGEEQVLIMVDTVDHALNIKRFLPEYKVAYATCSKAYYQEYLDKGWLSEPMVTPKDLDNIQEQFESGELKHLICTPIFKEGVNFKYLKALIRCDGQAGVIPATQIPGRLSRTAEGKDKAILVDFYDGFDKRLEGCSKARIKAYTSKGWNIIYKS